MIKSKRTVYVCDTLWIIMRCINHITKHMPVLIPVVVLVFIYQFTQHTWLFFYWIFFMRFSNSNLPLIICFAYRQDKDTRWRCWLQSITAKEHWQQSGWWHWWRYTSRGWIYWRETPECERTGKISSKQTVEVG